MQGEIGIIGLGQIGASVGLALLPYKETIRRTGNDRTLSQARAAQKLDAVDQIHSNLAVIASQSDLLILAVQTMEAREVLEELLPRLKPNSVVIDFTPAREALTREYNAKFPAGCAYVGLTATLNPAVLHEVKTGLDGARADLFQNGIIALSAAPGTPVAAIELAMDLVHILGGKPLFIDAAEADGYLSATHLLPLLSSLALLESTIDQPGWEETRKMAGRAFAQVTAPLADVDLEPGFADTLLASKGALLHHIDRLMDQLFALRQLIAEGDRPSLDKRIQHALDGRAVWFAQRQKAEWTTPGSTPPMDMPKASDTFNQLFLGRLLSRRPEKK